VATRLASAFSTEKLSAEEIEELKNRNELDGMMNELASYLPQVKETLIDERDRYLAAKIWTSAELLPADKETHVVAVVGAGHMQGIKSHLEKISGGEENSDVLALNTIPPKGFLAKAAGWIIPALIVGLIAAGFFRNGAGMSLAMIQRWVLWNGSLAALGAIIALGHPLAILVSFLGAPLTSLTPVVGVGLFSGLTQAMFRKPRVQDAETIISDVGSLKGIYRNRISHTLLVFFMSSLGSSIGTFISIPAIASTLF
jgi:pheromone shutdown-related protein TraB